ncbi:MULTISPECIES: hypothetical protein [unclassified Streptomyces]|uniref:hypothetical protein n=1 Tax=unclassified Streptomyces TaxID=2593676 RepID=UPI001487C7F5|nr:MULTISPECIES: hypothetical protein [unclassified Streptomyces]
MARAAQRSPFLQGQLLTNLAEALVEGGRPADARAVAAMISHFPSRRSTFAQLAAAADRPGARAADAVETALADVAPELASVARQARELALNGDRERAAALTAELLAIGPWTACVPVLALVDPEALRAAADDLLAGLDGPRAPSGSAPPEGIGCGQ